MLKTWSFWKVFFTTYLALVAGIWGFVEAYTYFESNSLKQFLGSNWWVYYYLGPLFIAILFAVWAQSSQEGQAETLDQHNRRVMLNHVENFWVKGILESSLHGAALLELGIKEDPSAINYPWAIKRESTNETLPAGKSMLKIFEEIGAGRSLLILGEPGSGKTTMLIELAGQLIESARNDETEPIPVVFNLASWTEKQSLADWLADQLNIVYYVPKNTAQKWVSENKMLLLLDGLDEVKQESRAKCVEAVNQFRNEHGLTSLVISSRIEEYEAINTKLSFEGAISIQSLTSEQVNTFFDNFGKSLARAKRLLKQDKVLRELMETPLMLSIMALAYKDRDPGEIPQTKNIEDQRKYLFNAYINRMFERSNRTTKSSYTKTQTLHYLHWLAHKMIHHNLITYQIEAMQPSWLEDKFQRRLYILYAGLIGGIIGGMIFGLIIGLFSGRSNGLYIGLIMALMYGLAFGVHSALANNITMIDNLRWSWRKVPLMLIAWIIVGSFSWLMLRNFETLVGSLILIIILGGLIEEQTEETTRSGQRLKQTLYNGFVIVMLTAAILVLVGMFFKNVTISVLVTALILGLIFGMFTGGIALSQHYSLRFVLARYGLLPQRLIPFLEYVVNLIMLRRVGGSYIFVHRLLMEHFAEMKE